MTTDLSADLRAFAAAVQAEYEPLAGESAWPEEQLKRHVAELVERVGAAAGVDDVRTKFESAVAGVGRPDLAVYAGGLLVGHVELKKPGKGANAPRFKGHDKRQWGQFSRLDNVVYTDGAEFALYRRGERHGPILKLGGDPRDDGADAVTDANGRAAADLWRAFFGWQPKAPTKPKALAELLAPVARYLRDDVEAALADADSPLAHLAADWRRVFFPDATDAQFADAYAQTLTYALLLARLSGADDLSTDDAVAALRPGHALLAEALRVLGDPRARAALGSTVDLLDRIIAGVDPGIFERQGALVEDGPAHAADPWLYFYEDFLAEYDPKMRRDRGVYYTPWQVVQAQVRLTAHLLDAGFDKPYGVASQDVVTLDPAAGTGTYILGAVRHALDRAQADGRGVASAATRAAQGVHAFEILVGPYAVAHLRLTQQIRAAGGRLPDDGAHVYLTDTLEDPETDARTQAAPFALKELAQEHRRAQRVKAGAPVLLCLGNPPYDRQQAAAGETIGQRKGGWVRHGHVVTQAAGDTAEVRSRAILRDFLDPLAATGDGVHAKNLYNDYVYFWRWALWKTVGPDSGSDGGIVSFITASSFLRGPGFKGMRRLMRETFDEIWVLDLGGDNLGARKSDNVFAIQTPVCITTGVRYRDGDPRRQNPAPGSGEWRVASGEWERQPARVRYARLADDEQTKLDQLARIETFDSVDGFEGVAWAGGPTGWDAPFLPARSEAFLGFPAVTDLFPWQESGLQFCRSWPLASDRDTLERRWASLLGSDNRAEALKESRDRKVDKLVPRLDGSGAKDPTVASLPVDAPPPEPQQIAFRSFDRQWAFLDNRLGDYLRPRLCSADSDRQSYITAFLTEVPGEGPLAAATHLLPDYHHFRGSFGGKHVIPLYRDPAGRHPNVASGALARLAAAFGERPAPEDVFAYAFALLAAPAYVATFWEALETPGPRLPLTADPALFAEVAALGRRLLWLHTYGERFVPEGARAGTRGLPRGGARVSRDTPQEPARYPDAWAYDPAARRLTVGEGADAGVIDGVPPPVMAFTLSGFAPAKSWLDYRMASGAGRTSSPLDAVRPRTWSFDDELLDLLWVLEAVLADHPAADALLARVLAGDTLAATSIPPPTAAERKGPDGLSAADDTAPLFAGS